MLTIEWTGRQTTDPQRDGVVHQARVNGKSVAVFVSNEVMEDQLPDFHGVAESKINEHHRQSGEIPDSVDVVTADWPEP